MKQNKLIKKKKTQADSVHYRQSIIGTERDLPLLERCQVLWNNLSYFREKRARALRFVYGDQWGDLITVNGVTTTQREYVTKKGNVALQTNQIKKMVTTVSGVYTKEQNEPVCHSRDREEQRYGEIMTTALQTNWNINKMPLLMIVCMEDAYIGGLCVEKENYGNMDGVFDVWSEVVNPNYVFFDSTMKDARNWDVSLIGEIHDIPFNKFLANFCHSEEDVAKAVEWYKNQSHPMNQTTIEDASNKNDASKLTFYSPVDTSLCRVFEVWTKEVKPRYRIHDWNTGELYTINADDTDMLNEIEQINNERKQLAIESGWAKNDTPLIEKHFFLDEYWYCKYLTPQGDIIWEGEAPYGNMHPYSMCAVPFIDGKIVSPIADAIDMNMAINRLLTLHDWVLRSGAKGVTMVPEQLVPEDMDYKEFADQWTSVDGLIFYKAKPGVPTPQQFYGQTANLNTAEMIRMMNELMESSVAVQGALQGKQPYSGTSAALYAQQTQNASNPIATFFTRFNVFVENLAIKKLKIIQKNYNSERYRIIAGSIDGAMLEGLNIDKTGMLEYDLRIKQSTETPVYRMIANDTLMQFWEKGAITLQEVLKHGYFPFADSLLQDMEADQQEVATGASPQGVMQPENQDAYNRAKQMMMNQ